MKKEIIIVLILLVVICVLIAIYLYFENNTLQISKYNIKNDRLPNGFTNYKIAHISDFHNTKSEKLKKSILKSLQKEQPDILVITGDLIDSYHTDIKISQQFINKIKDIPIYYVAGNHESRIKEYSKFKQELIKMGVNVLENQNISIKNNKDEINVIGIEDPSFETRENNSEEMQKIIDSNLQKLYIEDKFNILIIHRPELLETYAKNNIDLVFAGHAHGGQFRIPFIGPLIAPNQGLFPKLTSGVNHLNNTDLVISRGIGNSRIEYRINNNPELIYVTLEKAK